MSSNPHPGATPSNARLRQRRVFFVAGRRAAGRAWDRRDQRSSLVVDLR